MYKNVRVSSCERFWRLKEYKFRENEGVVRFRAKQSAQDY